MKRKFLFLLMAAALVMGFAACSEDDEPNKNDDDFVVWDFTPIEFCIYITDSTGHDLLDSTYQDNILRNVHAEFDGKSYNVITQEEYYAMRNGTRFYMPEFYGLKLYKADISFAHTPTNYFLMFGEFSGEENVECRKITLFIPDGNKVELSYGNHLTWDSQTNEPIISREFYLNGSKLSDSNGKYGVYHFQYIPGKHLTYIPH